MAWATSRIYDVDAAVAALPEAEVPAELARANEAFAERVRVETDALLGKVLYTRELRHEELFRDERQREVGISAIE